MDLSELLMLEHAIIRLKSANLHRQDSSFEELNKFVVKWHANIEDEIYFSTLVEQLPDNSDLASSIKRISADHKLIQTLGENLEKWKGEGKVELFKERLALYVKLLREHNDLEEKTVFPHWKVLPSEIRNKTLRKTLESFTHGLLEWYCSYTGISSDFLDYMKE